MRVAVTGATGYIGGRLVPLLLERGHAVRVLVRDPARVAGRAWAEQVEVVRADLLDAASVAPALANVDAAYYMVHAMGGGRDFAARDRAAAEHFVAAGAGLRRVVYLGGLLPDAADVSEHLGSRAEVGRILRDGLPALELRAGPVIGSGSASFEMVRYLTERLPVMVAPRWIVNPVQPIAVRDMLAYLLRALEHDATGVVEVGAEPLSFRDMMLEYAAVRGLRRVILPVPVLAPALAARWVGLVTPLSNRLAVPLIEGVVHPVVGDTARARELFPDIEPLPYRQAVELALERTRAADVQTRWSGALGAAPDYELHQEAGLVREVRSLSVAAPPEAVFATLAGVGGQRGWPAWGWAWWVRGALDKLVGGPGLRRGRRHPDELLPGDALDFWRVEAVEPPRRLLLRAEMRVPGKAWLEWEVLPEEGGSRLVQTAHFAPRGLSGAMYWKLLYPVHRRIFSDMVRALGRAAEAAR